ncbi:hypothetical protein WJR50_30080 [Catalinimonas sp. 4WD22]|uniref:hypothetical protein n=1 Tax=Catalinimonas locisalis TaxID=3133978 RepID=UPI0031011893
MSVKFDLKKEIIEKCLSIKKEQFNALHESQRLQLESTSTANLDQQDKTESPREGMMQVIENTASSLDFLAEQVNVLESLQTEGLHTRVSLGSVVYTSMGKFLIAVAQDKFQVQDVLYQGISAQSPFFKKIEGLSSGDHFDENQEILKVF